MKKSKKPTTINIPLNLEQHEQLMLLKKVCGIDVSMSITFAVAEYISKLESSDSVAGGALRKWKEFNFHKRVK